MMYPTYDWPVVTSPNRDTNILSKSYLSALFAAYRPPRSIRRASTKIGTYHQVLFQSSLSPGHPNLGSLVSDPPQIHQCHSTPSVEPKKNGSFENFYTNCIARPLCRGWITSIWHNCDPLICLPCVFFSCRLCRCGVRRSSARREFRNAVICQLMFLQGTVYFDWFLAWDVSADSDWRSRVERVLEDIHTGFQVPSFRHRYYEAGFLARQISFLFRRMGIYW